MTVVITPIGTSLFTNAIKQGYQIGDEFEKIEGTPADQWGTYSSERSKIERESQDFIRNVKTSASAELQSTERIQNARNSDITVHLLASDTIASRLAAGILSGNVVCGIFSGLSDTVTVEFNPDRDVISGLQVQNRQDFLKEGMNSLIRRIDQINSTAPGDDQSLAINITGGYGATLPHLTIYAQLKYVMLYYNFENSNELIEIPPSPLSADWAAIAPNFNVLQKIEDGEALSGWKAFKNEHLDAVNKLRPFILVEKNDNSAYLSPLGDIFWKQFLESHFVVELANTIKHDTTIKDVIQDLYNRLKTVLFPTSTTSYTSSNECYKKIRNLGDQNDLNHSGWIKEHKIFIFKSTDKGQIRLMYSFEVNVKARVITRIKIYRRNGHITDKEYNEWKGKIKKILPEIEFDVYTYDIPKS